MQSGRLMGQTLRRAPNDLGRDLEPISGAGIDVPIDGAGEIILNGACEFASVRRLWELPHDEPRDHGAGQAAGADAAQRHAAIAVAQAHHGADHGGMTFAACDFVKSRRPFTAGPQHMSDHGAGGKLLARRVAAQQSGSRYRVFAVRMLQHELGSERQCDGGQFGAGTIGNEISD